MKTFIIATRDGNWIDKTEVKAPSQKAAVARFVRGFKKKNLPNPDIVSVEEKED